MWPHSNKPLRLALIGMSGAGKSYWTTRIAAAGYPAISCDTEIESRLKPALESGGYCGINGVAAWMGWVADLPHSAPFHPGSLLSPGVFSSLQSFGQLIVLSAGACLLLTSLVLYFAFKEE